MVIDLQRIPGGWAAHIRDGATFEKLGPLPLPLTDAATIHDAIAHMADIGYSLAEFHYDPAEDPR